MNKNSHPKEFIALLPPSIYGNIGDAKAMMVCAQYLQKEGRLIILNYEQGSFDFVAPDAESISQFGSFRSTSFYNTKNLRKIWLIAIAIIQCAWNLPKVIGALRRSKRLVILALDILDGHYGFLSAGHKIFLAYIASALGTQVDIINCSFNDHPSLLAKFFLKHLPRNVRIVAREPRSHARMEKFLSRPIDLSADVTFLFEPEPHEKNSLQHYIDWIHAEQEKERYVIAMNIADNQDYDLDRLIDMYVRTIHEIKNASFLLLPHSRFQRKNLPDEYRIMEKVLEHVAPEDRPRCNLVQIPCDISDLHSLLPHLDYGLSGRMHLAIGMVSVGVPVCCITFQNKFDGLLIDYLNLPELLPEMKNVFSEGSFTEVLSALLPTAKEQANRIREKLPWLREQALNNFKS